MPCYVPVLDAVQVPLETTAPDALSRMLQVPFMVIVAPAWDALPFRKAVSLPCSASMFNSPVPGLYVPPPEKLNASIHSAALVPPVDWTLNVTTSVVPAWETVRLNVPSQVKAPVWASQKRGN